MTGYNGLEGMDVPETKEKEEDDETEGLAVEKKKCEGEDCVTEGAKVQAPGVAEIDALLKKT
jgi:hypothetical protein